MKLLCIISQALEPPLFINWFYNQKQIYLHNRKGWHTEIERIELPPDTTTTTTTTATTTTSTTSTPSTSTTTKTSTAAYPSNALSPSSSSMLNGSEIPAMHVFTSITPQQSLNDGNLLESVSESTYNNYYPNLKEPEAASILTTLKTQMQTLSTTTTTTTTPSALPMSSESIAGLGVERGIASSILTATTTTTLPIALPGSETVETTTLSFNDDNNDKNNDNDANDDNNSKVDDDDDEAGDDDDDDYHRNPTVTTFETAEAIAAARGYMMLSSLMTVTDVKQITVIDFKFFFV